MPLLEEAWPNIEADVKKLMIEPALSKIRRKLSPQEMASHVAQGAVIVGVRIIEQLAEARRVSGEEIVVA